MLKIYYEYYKRGALSVREVSALEHETGRELLRTGLSDLYGLSFSHSELETQIVFEPDGKPYLKDHPACFFNISHCDGLVVCAFADVPVGIDAEKPGYFADVLVNRILSEEEKFLLEPLKASKSERDLMFIRFWTLKEAYAKLSGEGMDADVRRVSFRPGTLHLLDPADEVISPRGEVGCSEPDLRAWQYQLEGGYVLAVCTRFI